MIKVSDILTEEQIEYYRKNPVEFIEKLLLKPKGAELSTFQADIINSIWDKNVYGIKSDNIGKTMALALTAIAFITLYSGKVFMISPSEEALNTVTMPEIRKWIAGSLIEENFTFTKDMVRLKEDKSGNTFIQTRVALESEPERLQGICGDYIMFLVDDVTLMPENCMKVISFHSTIENQHIGMVGRSNDNSSRLV